MKNSSERLEETLPVQSVRWQLPKIAFALSMCVLVGCHDPEGRQPVEGIILLDGNPLQEGRVSLRPVSKGPTAGGKIVDGKFEIGKEKGPLPGTYSVSIQSFAETGRMISPESNPGMKVPEIKQILPEQYNTKTELRMEVSGTEDNQFNYELKSDGSS